MSEENIVNITKSGNNFSPIFVDQHILSDINFSKHCLINNNISIPKKSNKSIYFLQTSSRVKKFQHRFCIK